MAMFFNNSCLVDLLLFFCSSIMYQNPVLNFWNTRVYVLGGDIITMYDCYQNYCPIYWEQIYTSTGLPHINVFVIQISKIQVQLHRM